MAATSCLWMEYSASACRFEVRVLESLGERRWKVLDKAAPKDQLVSMEREMIGSTNMRRFLAVLSCCADKENGARKKKQQILTKGK